MEKLEDPLQRAPSGIAVLLDTSGRAWRLPLEGSCLCRKTQLSRGHPPCGGGWVRARTVKPLLSLPQQSNKNVPTFRHN